ncbi:hypothetical protein [Paracoccus mutanolyticus]|uniref:hypothetical protein n=1 Tax=Paracoccus mutanolyticus TaxID=1499308 RepID=UPI0011AE70E1|nr:hypothetical protein [Paracoccus mutanolyticus]
MTKLRGAASSGTIRASIVARLSGYTVDYVHANTPPSRKILSAATSIAPSSAFSAATDLKPRGPRRLCAVRPLACPLSDLGINGDRDGCRAARAQGRIEEVVDAGRGQRAGHASTTSISR